MSRTKRLTISLIQPVLVTLLLLVSTVSHAQSICVDVFSKTTRTEIKNEYIGKNSFLTARSFFDYVSHFPFRYGASLKDLVLKLTEGSVWIDMGAGQGRALVDGLKLNPKIAEGIGISFKRPESTLDETEVAGRFRYLDGDYVENMVRDGKLDSVLGRVDLITDVFGPASYSENIQELLQNYFDLLRKDGRVLLNIMTERNYDNHGKSMRVFKEPIAVNSSELLIKWLKTIPGIEVVETAEFKTNFDQIWEKSVALKIRKTSDHVTVPKTLHTNEYVSSTPPKRSFEIRP